MDLNSFSGINFGNSAVVEFGKTLNLNCTFELGSGEELYSVLWYFTKPPKVGDPDKIGAKSDEDSELIPIFRYRSIDDRGKRKKAWEERVRGSFQINVVRVSVRGRLPYAIIKLLDIRQKTV